MGICLVNLINQGVKILILLASDLEGYCYLGVDSDHIGVFMISINQINHWFNKRVTVYEKGHNKVTDQLSISCPRPWFQLFAMSLEWSMLSCFQFMCL
jgi:hypothetical protein